MKNLLLLLLLPLPLLFADDVREVAGHRYPVHLQSKDLDWSLSGADHFRFRLFSVFTGALYTTESDADARRLTFTYTRRLGADTLVEQGMRVLREAKSAEDIDARKDLIDKVNDAYQDVSKGDRYTFTVIPDRGTWLHLNDKEILFLQDADFGLWYLNIWLGDQPMSAPLRNALLEGIN
ncbi:MAG: chalcone isomerase family protein [Verrucomicrobia bacterium]|nr:chalcone isomerase family protein [Verrucomicrobiota bacterium]MCH8527338.1 chalcone isomerase family protein [Kiritimatiellia bacterium]